MFTGLLLLGMAAALGAGLTFYSGFGLGTLLLPVFALLLPLPTAVAATAVVHLVNNLGKVALVGRHAHWPLVLKFALPAALAALGGGLLLNRLGTFPPLACYHLAGHLFCVTGVKLLIGLLIGTFALLELSPRHKTLAFDPRWVPLGGALSGFFGGLSGHQGALRAAFLVRLGLEKQVYISTVAICAVVVDLSRLATYSATFLPETLQGTTGYWVAAGIVGALTGSVLANRLMPKVTLTALHQGVGLMLMGYAAALMAGLI